MALGGGVFLTQNKKLPGSYINFASTASASASLSERGIVAMPLELDWGPEGTVFTVAATELVKNSLALFGYAYTHDKLKLLRDLFLNSTSGHFFRLGTGGVKASNTYAEALYPGVRGNDIRIVIEAGETHTASNPSYIVSTFFDTKLVDTQAAADVSGLNDNAYVSFKSTAALALTAGTPLSGGTNGTINDGDHQTALDKLESYGFNVLGCPSSNATIKQLYAAFTKRMRDEAGVKFQLVVHKYTGADYEGVISVENNDNPDIVYWVTGAEAGCAVNKTLTNAVYNGECEVDTDYTQAELEVALGNGQFILHKVGDEVRVLEDFNTLVTYTSEKGSDFSSNQTIRVLDQVATDIATLFNDKYLGKIPNDAAGRVSLWNDIVKHHKDLETIRAIEDFEPGNITVEQGDTKKSVVVTEAITPANAMSQLYMTVVVE